LLLLVAGAIFYLFFKQLFSGEHPKRGVDFEAKRDDAQIGGINRPDKTFSEPAVQMSRLEQLLQMSQEALERGDKEEAKKALGSAHIIEPHHIEVLQRLAHLCMQMERYEEAKEYYLALLKEEPDDDMAHAMLANVLHYLGEDSASEVHHKKSIILDKSYAPHHYNYANTLYDLGRKEEALVYYKEAYRLDPSLEEAKKMIERLGEKSE